jgi:hypothetical protein
MASNIGMDSGIGKGWKGVVLYKFGVLSRHFPGETKEKDETLSHDSRSLATELNPAFLQHEAHETLLRKNAWNVTAVPHVSSWYCT